MSTDAAAVKLRLAVVTLFPDMFQALHFGVIEQAFARGLIEMSFINPRDFTSRSSDRVDDRPFGGGPGMVMQVEPLYQAIMQAKQQLPQARVIHLSPCGRPVTHSAILSAYQNQSLILLSSRYEGVDERLVDLAVDEQWSVGDFVVSGGELPAMMCIDAMARMIPGVLGHPESAAQDSFAQGVLDCPHYTRPAEIYGMTVPEVLRQGNHQAIAKWRGHQALKRTWLRRPDLLAKVTLSEEQKSWLHKWQDEEK